jgi:hypothetical protein
VGAYPDKRVVEPMQGICGARQIGGPHLSFEVRAQARHLHSPYLAAAPLEAVRRAPHRLSIRVSDGLVQGGQAGRRVAQVDREQLGQEIGPALALQVTQSGEGARIHRLVGRAWRGL